MPVASEVFVVVILLKIFLFTTNEVVKGPPLIKSLMINDCLLSPGSPNLEIFLLAGSL